MKRLLLAGGGHAHLFVLEAAARGAFPGTALTVVSPDTRQVYSGMVPGFIAGRYTHEEISFDLAAITAAVGGKFVRGRLRRVDAPSSVAVLEDGSALSYDVASVAIGSESRGSAVPGVTTHARLSKPIAQVTGIAVALEELARASSPEPKKIVVAGGGAGGIELALAVRARLDQLGAGQAIITLHDTGPELFSGAAPQAVAAVERLLQEREITVRTGSRIEEVGHDYVRLSGGRVVPADLTIWATGPAAPVLLAESGLQTDAAGFMVVDDQLTAIGSHGLFGAGDVATLRSAPRTPKSGVYAVRQGPVLAHNLAVALQSTGTLRRYVSQPHALALLNASDGRAILCYGTTVVTSRWAMRLKDWIDRRFMRRFQRLADRQPR